MRQLKNYPSKYENNVKSVFRRLASQLLALSAPILLFGACSECKTNADCYSGEICVSDRCRSADAVIDDETDTQPKTSDSTVETDPAGSSEESDIDTNTSSESDTDRETESASLCTDPAVDCPPSSECSEYVCEDAACVSVVVNGDLCGGTDNPCMSGICVEGTCETVPLSNISCASDDNECTQDICVAGVCEHRPKNGGPCEDDGDPCTEDICIKGVCGSPLTGTSCDTDDADCRLDICKDGACVSTPEPDGLSCDNGLWCDGIADVCMKGTCTPKTGAAPCISTNPCIDLSCEEPGQKATEGTCKETLLSGTSCDDGVFCNGDDVCAEGVCTHVDAPCPPGTAPCAFGVCNETSDACEFQNVADGDPCLVQDGFLCNGTERCEAGECIAGDKFCPVFSDCTQNICTEGVDGALPTCEGIEAADDGLPCESTAVCEGGGTRICMDGVCADGETPACAPREQDGNLCTRYTLCYEEDGAPVCAIEEDDRGGFLGIACGETISFDTTQENNEVSSYSSSACKGDFTGGEVAIEIDGAGAKYSIALYITKTTIPSEDLYLLKVDDPCAAADTCTKASTIRLSGINSTDTNTPDVIVIDGTGGNRGKGTVTLTCN